MQCLCGVPHIGHEPRFGELRKNPSYIFMRGKRYYFMQFLNLFVPFVLFSLRKEKKSLPHRFPLLSAPFCTSLCGLLIRTCNLLLNLVFSLSLCVYLYCLTCILSRCPCENPKYCLTLLTRYYSVF